MIRNVLDPRHEAVRQPMGEAIEVDGSGSPPSTQIIFSAIDKEKEGDCALPPKEGEGLQDAVARRPGEPPPPLRKPLKIYPPLSDLRRSPHLHLRLPKHCLRLKKIGRIFSLTKELLKQSLLLAENPLRWASPKQKKKKREREKKKKEKKNNRNKKDFTNKKCFSYGQMRHFCWQCPAKQRKQAMPINPR